MTQAIDQQLIDAASDGDIKSVEHALQAGADVHAEGGHALWMASWRGHLDVVELLLKSGADVHANDDLALRWAAEKGHKDVAELLLKSGANIHAESDFALRYAAYYGHLDVVSVLLKHGADVHARGDFALQLAARFRRDAVVGRLVKADADLTTLFYAEITREQRTVMIKEHAATAYRGYEAVMMLEDDARRDVLSHLHPELKPKQIRDELAMMEALGLDEGQMGEMWRAQHGTVTTQQEIGVAL